MMQHNELVDIHYKILYVDRLIHVQVKNEDFLLNHKQPLKLKINFLKENFCVKFTKM
jgi:hypothetical protein